MDNGFIFLHWGKSIPLIPQGKDSGKWPQCVLKWLQGEWGHVLLSQDPVSGQSISSQERKDATLQGKGGFPLWQGTVSKYVFYVCVIFCLEKWQGHLCEHLNWPWESQHLHLLGAFCGLLSWEEVQRSLVPNPTFHMEMEISLLLFDLKGLLVVYLQSQGKLAVEYFAFGNTGPNSKKFDVLFAPCPVFS